MLHRGFVFLALLFASSSHCALLAQSLGSKSGALGSVPEENSPSPNNAPLETASPETSGWQLMRRDATLPSLQQILKKSLVGYGKTHRTPSPFYEVVYSCTTFGGSRDWRQFVTANVKFENMNPVLGPQSVNYEWRAGRNTPQQVQQYLHHDTPRPAGTRPFSLLELNWERERTVSSLQQAFETIQRAQNLHERDKRQTFFKVSLVKLVRQSPGLRDFIVWKFDDFIYVGFNVPLAVPNPNAIRPWSHPEATS